MKSYLLCFECVFIFSLCRFVALAEDTATAPPVTAPENISSESTNEETKESEESDGGDLIRDLEPSADVASSFVEKVVENGDTFQQVFAEATSQNSGVANEITNSGQPVVVTLGDVATAELQQRAIIPSQNANDNSQTSNQTESPKVAEDFAEINQSRSEATPPQTDKIDILNVKENLTEEIPSFSEWAQKQLLEEAEKNKEPTNASAQHQGANGKHSGAKLRWKNYASLDCGAKVVASNPEAVSPSAILSPSRDEYKLNTCTSRIWFVVELCEAIQAKKIDFANFELFSSSPRDFVVSVSDRFPTRDWSNVGQFTAKDERDIQSFDLHPHLFGKYIKVEVKSHYGSEHYCPISLFRVYGTSEFEVLQKEDPGHAERLEEDDDDDDADESLDVETGDASKNLFSSATDAVISMVKKAAEVLGNKGNHSNQTSPSNLTKQPVPLIRVCTSPSHLIVCDNCSDALFGRVYELLSCERARVTALTFIPSIARILTETNACHDFGLDFSKATQSQSNFLRVFFPDRYLGAMCNLAAVAQSKIVLNVSHQYANETEPKTTEDALVHIETSEPLVVPRKEPEATDALILDASDAKSTCSTDVSYSAQIRPTKTLPEVELGEGRTEVVVEEGVNEEEQVEVEEVEEAKLGEVESVEALEDPLEQFMEFNGEKDLASAQTTSSTPQAQKESVFLRLSNRIKALERNMSLSGQYLEELSKRYKKQVEEIQKLLDKTIASMSEETKKQADQNKHLEERLATLTSTIESLIAEKRSWSSTIYCVIVSSLVTLFVVTFCWRLPEPLTPPKPDMKRRRSVEVASQAPPQKKKRRPSDQALKIVRSSMEAGRRRRKKAGLKRSNSIGALGEGKGQVWTRQESAPAEAPADWVEGKHLEEVPFVLEESEHSSLEPPPNFFKTALALRAARSNGEAVKVARKSASVDETSRKSPTTALNGSVAVEGKKERKGLRRILRKVF